MVVVALLLVVSTTRFQREGRRWSSSEPSCRRRASGTNARLRWDGPAACRRSACVEQSACAFRIEAHRSRSRVQLAYRFSGAHTDKAESCFSRVRLGEAGHDHHISGPYLPRFA